jgi:hypothetical protein
MFVISGLVDMGIPDDHQQRTASRFTWGRPRLSQGRGFRPAELAVAAGGAVSCRCRPADYHFGAGWRRSHPGDLVVAAAGYRARAAGGRGGLRPGAG